MNEFPNRLINYPFIATNNFSHVHNKTHNSSWHYGFCSIFFPTFSSGSPGFPSRTSQAHVLNFSLLMLRITINLHEIKLLAKRTKWSSLRCSLINGKNKVIQMLWMGKKQRNALAAARSISVSLLYFTLMPKSSQSVHSLHYSIWKRILKYCLCALSQPTTAPPRPTTIKIKVKFLATIHVIITHRLSSIHSLDEAFIQHYCHPAREANSVALI